MRFSTSITFTLFAAATSIAVVSAASEDIPANASANCTSQMNALDVDKTLGSYLQQIVSVTEAKKTSANLTDTLAGLCKPQSAAQATTNADTIKMYLTNFWAACSAEIQESAQSGQANSVGSIYDILYLLQPFKNAICAKDADTNDYCVQHIASYSNSSQSGGAASVAARQAPATTASVDNVDNINSTETTDTTSEPNIAFLFLEPTMDKSVLCSSCTTQILRSYIGFEMQSPYAVGLANSQLFGGQHALYTAVQNQCGSEFMAGINTDDIIGKFLVTQNGAMASRGPVTAGLLAFVAIASVLVVIY